MNYTIFSIDDTRAAYKQLIRQELGKGFWWEERETHCINGADTDVDFWIDWFGLTVNTPEIKVGQLGIWFTVLRAMGDLGKEPFVTFEDDAILHPAFNDIFWMVTSTLPKDTDAFALFLPRDQDSEFQPGLMRSKLVCRAYQRYGGVSMLWTPKGVKKFKQFVGQDGILGQWDDQLFAYAKAGKMNVYTQPPTHPILVEISGYDESIVQESEFYK